MLSEKQIHYIHTNKLNMLRNALALHIFCTEHLASMLLIYLFFFSFQSRIAISKHFTLKRENHIDGEYYYLHFTEDIGTEGLINVFRNYTG